MILFEWFLDKLTNVEVLQQKLSEKEEEEKERIGKDIKVGKRCNFRVNNITLINKATFTWQ